MGFFDIGGSAKKVGKRIKELERLYGIEHGGDRKSQCQNGTLLTLDEIAGIMGISISTLENYKNGEKYD